MNRQNYYQSSNNFGAPRRLLRTTPERYAHFNGYNSHESAYSNWYNFNPRPRPRRITRRFYRILPPNDYRVYDTLNTGDRFLDYYEPSKLSTRSFPRRTATPASYLYDCDNRFLPHPTYSRKREETCRCHRLEDDSDSDESPLSYDEDVDDESDFQSHHDELFSLNGCHCKKNLCKRPIIYYVPCRMNSNQSIPFTSMPETSRHTANPSETNHESTESKPKTALHPVYTSPNDSIYLQSKPETSSHPVYTNPEHSGPVHSDHRKAKKSAVQYSDFDTSRHCLPKCQFNCNRKYCTKSSLDDSSEHSEFSWKYLTKDQSASKTDSVIFVKEPPERTLSTTTYEFNDEPVREHVHKSHRQSPKLDSGETEKQIPDHTYDSQSRKKPSEKEEIQSHHSSHLAEPTKESDETKKTQGHQNPTSITNSAEKSIPDKKEGKNDHHKLQFSSDLNDKNHEESVEIQESSKDNKFCSSVEKKDHNKTNGTPGNVLDSKNNTCGCIPDTKNSSKSASPSRPKSKIPSVIKYVKLRGEHPEKHCHTSFVQKHDESESKHK